MREDRSNLDKQKHSSAISGQRPADVKHLNQSQQEAVGELKEPVNAVSNTKTENMNVKTGSTTVHANQVILLAGNNLQSNPAGIQGRTPVIEVVSDSTVDQLNEQINSLELCFIMQTKAD